MTAANDGGADTEREETRRGSEEDAEVEKD
jgi:hypothetical protein